MNTGFARLRRFVPVVVFGATVFLGWVLLASPIVSDRDRAADRLALLKQREATLQAIVTAPQVNVAGDPGATFNARVATDPTGSLVERLARLAAETHARGLFIETEDGAISTGRGAPPVAAADQPDPRFALFDQRVKYTTIKMSFESDYAGLGQFFWRLRDLSSIVEVRTLNVQPRVPSSSVRTDGTLRASLTLFAYSRTSVPPAPDKVVSFLDRTPQWPRNPFVNTRLPVAVETQPPSSEKAAEPDLVVGSILYSAQRRLAIVNERIVGVGDRVGSVIVRDIETRAVIVEFSDGTVETLELRKPLDRADAKASRKVEAAAAAREVGR